MQAAATVELTITKIINETDDAGTFVLQPANGQPVSYHAGQFLTLLFNRNGRAIRRSYSFSSTPGVDEEISITVKRVHNGEISRLFLDYYKAGDQLTAIEPAGMFVLPADLHQQQTVFLIAAGSGITPVFSLLKQLLHQTAVSNIVLLYQNHTAADTIFREALGQLSQQFSKRFKWLDFISVSNALHRKLTNDYLEVLIQQNLSQPLAGALFYICGPASFMRMCQYTIRIMGFGEGQIRKEYFVIDPPPAPPLIKNVQSREVLLHSGGEIIRYQTQYPSTILQSALDNNIALPYSCKGGRCSACAARCVKGEVIMSMNDVLTDEDIASGLVLTCVGYAVTDVELEYDGSDKP